MAKTSCGNQTTQTAITDSLRLTRISKKEAVERLWIQAIKLHYNGGDEYAVHLLLMSAFRVCRDLVLKKNPEKDLVKKQSAPVRNSFFAGDGTNLKLHEACGHS